MYDMLLMTFWFRMLFFVGDGQWHVCCAWPGKDMPLHSQKWCCNANVWWFLSRSSLWFLRNWLHYLFCEAGFQVVCRCFYCQNPLSVQLGSTHCFQGWRTGAVWFSFRFSKQSHHNGIDLSVHTQGLHGFALVVLVHFSILLKRDSGGCCICLIFLFCCYSTEMFIFALCRLCQEQSLISWQVASVKHQTIRNQQALKTRYVYTCISSCIIYIYMHIDLYAHPSQQQSPPALLSFSARESIIMMIYIYIYISIYLYIVPCIISWYKLHIWPYLKLFLNYSQKPKAISKTPDREWTHEFSHGDRRIMSHELSQLSRSQSLKI